MVDSFTSGRRLHLDEFDEFARIVHEFNNLTWFAPQSMPYADVIPDGDAYQLRGAGPHARVEVQPVAAHAVPAS